MHAWEGAWFDVELSGWVQVVPQRGQNSRCEQFPNQEARILVRVPRGQVATVVTPEAAATVKLGVAQLTKSGDRKVLLFFENMWF